MSVTVLRAGEALPRRTRDMDGELRHTVKVKPSVKPICNKCRIIRRHGRVMVICADPRHKQRQG